MVTILPYARVLLVLLVVILARTIVLAARILFPTKTPVVVLTVTHRNFVVSKTRMTYLPVMNPWPRIFSEPITGFSVSPSLDYQPADEKSITSHCCRPLLNWTAPPSPLLH
jgi:hypothetical protein